MIGYVGRRPTPRQRELFEKAPFGNPQKLFNNGYITIFSAGVPVLPEAPKQKGAVGKTIGAEKSEQPEGTRIFGAVQQRLSRRRAKHTPDEVFSEF